MYKFSESSQEKLNSCHPFLQEICNELIKETDFTVLCGYRGKQEQNDAFAKGASKLKYPKSKHNSSPSLAIDIAPYPVNWNNHVAFKDLAIKFKHIAELKSINVTWGGDWKMQDLVHYQLEI